MTRHFNNVEAAITDLKANGFRRHASGYWLSSGKEFKASIHPVLDSAIVAVFYSEVK